MDLKQRYPNQLIAVCCELTKGPLVFALRKYNHLVLFPVNPSTVANVRKAFVHSGAKNDPSDANIQTDILSLYMDKLRPLVPDSSAVRALAQLTEYRRSLVQDRVDLSNRITALLKNYFPQVLDWFHEKDTHIFCDFLLKWPTLGLAKRARQHTLLNFFEAHNARYRQVNDKRIQAIKQAMSLTDDPGVIEPNQIMVECLLPQLKLIMDSIERLDRDIKQRYKKLDDHILFDSLPGAGPVIAPRLLVAFGSNRDRYQTASEMQKYAGVAPVIEQSGDKSWTHWRYSCPTFLRQTFVEWAGQTVRYSFWANAYYAQQKAKGKPHQTIIRSLAFKWIRIVFRCWKTRMPYDESKYLQALKKRNSPLLKFAMEA
ncbi:MAG: transposase [Gammaproteobacteria bacterium]|jgi:transposase